MRRCAEDPHEWYQCWILKTSQRSIAIVNSRQDGHRNQPRRYLLAGQMTYGSQSPDVVETSARNSNRWTSWSVESQSRRSTFAAELTYTTSVLSEMTWRRLKLHHWRMVMTDELDFSVLNRVMPAGCMWFQTLIQLVVSKTWILLIVEWKAMFRCLW